MEITRSDIKLVRELNQKFFGNHLGDQKEHLILNRLKKLYRSQSAFKNLSDMLDAVARGEYVQEFINAFTTNKTSFFRELIHFDDLRSRVFPEHFSQSNEIKIYSSASSTGEEPYSIAMTFLHYQINHPKAINATVYATDIDTDVLETAKAGIYNLIESDSPFPQWIQPHHYFQRRIISEYQHPLIRANETMKKITNFKQHNLLDHESAFGSICFDVIFCRNVLIYFDAPNQDKVLRKLFSTLKIGGTLYTGHSETPITLFPYIEKIGPSIFKKISNIDPRSEPCIVS
jgi:chemotaxis protein methyltransferase CheR